LISLCIKEKILPWLLINLKSLTLKNKKQLLFLFISLFTISLFAQNTYYVSVSGNDTNSGTTQVNAWKTIAFAASSLSAVSSGDTVFIKAGNYGQDDVSVNKNSSTTDERIYFIGYKNTPNDINSLDFEYGDNVDATKMPLITAGDRTIGDGISVVNKFNISFKNIQIANCLSGIYVWNSSSTDTKHIFENIFIQNIGEAYVTAIGMKEANKNTIKNCLIVNATGAGMDIWGDNNLIEDCKVYSNESDMAPGGSYTSMDYYIVLKGDSNTVKNCYIERDGNLEDVGHGMEIKESGEYNLFVDCLAKNMVGGCYSVRWSAVKYNEFRNCKAIADQTESTAFLVRDGASYNQFNSCISEDCGSGIQFLLSGEDAAYCGNHNTFNNCIIKNADWAIDLNDWDIESGTVDNNIIANCIIDNANYLFNSERPSQENQLINCIVTNVDNFVRGDSTLNFDFKYCNFYNNSFSEPLGTAIIEVNPFFVDASTSNYHLLLESECIDAGTDIDAPNKDFEGINRPQGDAFDLGVFEFVADNNPIGISSISLENNIFPNPSKNVVNFNETGAIDYNIYSIEGKFIFSNTIKNQQINIDHLANGNYLMKVNYLHSKQKTYKLIVKK